MSAETIPNHEPQNTSKSDKLSHIIPVSGLYENWFLDYASYVILERAVPYVEDGLKPVQRRILHAMKDLDDGRFNKVANIIGHTMKYHPHGDASIGDALVQLGQKDLMVETQGNWGNLYTGDSAAAPRYIEARLSKFALEVAFNHKTTVWQASYDGRNKEPVTLPVKFPLLLAQGVEGIAVGLACKILPHNFCELIEASIAVLKKQPINILPDFPTGGTADFANYNNGLRGGRIKVRAKIEKKDRKTLVICELPFGTTTSSLIETILTANDKGKIKIKKVEDNTSDKVEIVVHLHSDSYEDLDKTIDALYAFTDCEVSISPNCCIIQNDKPLFVGVNEILKISAHNTVQLLKKELEIRKDELEADWHFSSLEKIFIEKRIYRDIENCTTWEAVLAAIEKGLKPYKKRFKKEITQENIINLTEIKIKRISKFDSKKADEHIKSVEEQIAAIDHDLAHLTIYAVNYFKGLLKKYGKGKERKTQITEFGTIVATEVVVANQKLYVNRIEGFAGYGMKKDEFICDCSDIDDLITFRQDGTFIVTKISEKNYVGKDILHIAVFRKGDENTIYNMVYRDGVKGNIMVKRFSIGGVTRDKEYSLTKGTPNSKVLYFYISGEKDAETIIVHLKPKPKLRKLTFEFNFNELAVKGRSSIGNILSRNPIHKILKQKQGNIVPDAIAALPIAIPQLIEPPVNIATSVTPSPKADKQEVKVQKEKEQKPELKKITPPIPLQKNNPQKKKLSDDEAAQMKLF